MNRVEKAEFVSTLKEKVSKANAAFVTHYRGMTVGKLYDLRKKVRAGDGEVCVVKNRLAKIAIKGSFAEGLTGDLKGPVALILSYKDPVPVAKAITSSLNDESPFMMKTGTVFGKVVSAKEIEAIAKLPSREVLLSMLCSVLQGPVRNLAYTVQAIKEQKEKA